MELARESGPVRIARYREVRSLSERLAATLSPEDQQIQAFAYASPTKWHLGHVTWFFETFVLGRHDPGRKLYCAAFETLFNSYYEGLGPRIARGMRGLLSRPTASEVRAWRAAIDGEMEALLEGEMEASLAAMIELGLHHEQQHQELLLTDILANFSANPLLPAWRDEAIPRCEPAPAPQWIERAGGIVDIGHRGPGFHFDNEAPAHRAVLEPYALRTTVVTNAEVLAFIADGGYGEARLWLADGIAWVREHGITAPAYWRRDDDGRWWTFSLHGEQPLDPNAPATHVSGYEADAIATWLGARLPTEEEWEVAARSVGGDPAAARWLGNGPVTPLAGTGHPTDLCGLWGETWEWTRSAYAPYPGFRPLKGAAGEYNGKFMANQWVLRGGSCATPPGHIRATYRNFFYPHQRWQFTGVRLARDAR